MSAIAQSHNNLPNYGPNTGLPLRHLQLQGGGEGGSSQWPRS